MAAPSGTVTFLFTDVEGSTRLWEAAPASMGSALARHDSIIREAVSAHGGYVFATGGDGLAAAFTRAADAVAAAQDAQARLQAECWPAASVIRVRMAIHTGEVEERNGDYFGPAVNRAARLMALGHGGQVLCSPATAELVDRVEFVDLGVHRLRDLSVPHRVFQVGSARFPALRSLDASPSNLPAQASAFVGRERELVELTAALARSRMVTLTGVGGVGKTRLAIQCAFDVLPRFADGAWLVELAPLVDPDALVEAVASALGVPERQGQPLSASVVDFMRRKQLLVVLDNCEHLLDAVAVSVSAMVSACPQLVVLTTSREALRVDGERVVVVPSLSLPVGEPSLETAATSEAVQLFVARANQALGAFTLTSANAEAVARLVRRLDGIPLAIELAAARVRSLTPAELADRLDERFRLLAGGQRSAVERHQTLRRAIDWSYALLTEAEQTALLRAAVFAGDFSLASAEAVIAGGLIEAADVVDLLGRLVDKSLIAAGDHGGVSRYWLLETIREYAREGLEATGDAESVRAAHAACFAAFAAAAGDGLRGRDEVHWMHRVDADLDNMRAALAWSVGVGAASLALGVVAPLAVATTRTGDMIRTWATPVVALPGVGADPLYPQVEALAGYAEAAAGDLEAGIRRCGVALGAADALGVNERARCRVFASAVVVAAYAGDFDQVGRLVSRWVDLARVTQDDWELAFALSHQAFHLDRVGDVAAATASADEAMALARRLGNPSILFSAALLAGVVRRVTDPTQALQFLIQCADAAEALGNPLGVGMSLGAQAWTHCEHEEWPQAALAIVHGLEHLGRAGAHNLFGQLIGLGELILQAVGEDEAAAILLGKASVVTLRVYGPVWEQRQIESERSLRWRLGRDRFEQCAAEGRAMDIDEFAAYASRQLAHLTGQTR